VFIKLFGINFSRRFFSIKRNGYKLILSKDDISMSLLHHGKNSYASIEVLMKRLLKKGDNFIDIGGSIGVHSIYAKLIVENGTVILIEPMPNLVQIALDNFSLNKKDIKLIPGAITNNAKYVEMTDLEARSYINDNDLSDKNLVKSPSIIRGKKFNNHSENIIKVDAFSLDSVTENIDKIRLIKIDTEGAELFAIQSGVNTLKKVDALLVGLFNPYTLKRFGYKAIDTANLILSNGFEIFRVSDIGLSPVDLINEKFETTDYYIFIKKELINDFLTN
jgi:FkbM family methyltransferase